MSFHTLPVMFHPSGDPGKQLRMQDAALREFAAQANNFLEAAYPHVPHGIIDALEYAFVEFMCCGTREQLEFIEQQQAEYANYRRAPEDELIRLTEERDQIVARIAQAEQAKDQFPVEGMAGMVEATLIAPMRKELEFCEAQISALQQHIESAHAGEFTAQSNAEESANKKGSGHGGK